MATSSSETTPLLTDTSLIVEIRNATLNVPSAPNDAASLPLSAYFPRTRRILSILILAASVIAIILMVPLRTLAVRTPYSDLLYSTLTLIYFMMFTSILATITLIWNLPIFIHMILDVYIIYAIGYNCVLRILVLGWPNKYWCQPYNRPPVPECEAKLFTIQILFGFVIGMVLAVVLGHLALLILRNIALEKTKFWRRAETWQLPAGPVTLEASIRVLRQDGEQVSGPTSSREV